MKGISAKYLSSILDYIYTGQTTILQNNLADFLTLAEGLKLNVLAQNKGESGKSSYVKMECF